MRHRKVRDDVFCLPCSLVWAGSPGGKTQKFAQAKSIANSAGGGAGGGSRPHLEVLIYKVEPPQEVPRDMHADRRAAR